MENQNYAGQDLIGQDLAGLDESLQVGIPIIDIQHANLIRKITNLHFTCLKGKDATNLRFIRAVKEAADFFQHHFSTEEKLMSLLGYSDFFDHKNEHTQLIWEILNWVKDFQDEQSHDSEDFVCFLNEWILSHIAIADQAFADFFVTMKHHGKLRMILSGRTEMSTNSA